MIFVAGSRWHFVKFTLFVWSQPNFEYSFLLLLSRSYAW